MPAWFQCQSDAPNDPKVKAVLMKGGRDWAGFLWLLWCYVAREGKAEPGWGLDTEGRPLPLAEMATETLCLSNDPIGELKNFLDFLAARNHIDPDQWHHHQVVRLPAMERRLKAYRKAKGWAERNEKRKTERAQKKDSGGVTGPQKSGDGPAPPKGRALAADPIQDNTIRSNNKPPKPPKGGGGGNAKGPDLLSDPEGGQVRALVERYNLVAARTGPWKLPAVATISDKRRKQIQAVLKLVPNLADWDLIFAYMNTMAWSTGRTAANFVWSLDYLLKPDKAIQALERARAKQQPVGPATVQPGRDAARGRTGVQASDYAGLHNDGHEDPDGRGGGPDDSDPGESGR